MTTYLFQCPKAHYPVEVNRPMGLLSGVVCNCGKPMNRVYTSPRINWNGLAPSQGELSPAIQRHIERNKAYEPIPR